MNVVIALILIAQVSSADTKPEQALGPRYAPQSQGAAPKSKETAPRGTDGSGWRPASGAGAGPTTFSDPAAAETAPAEDGDGAAPGEVPPSAPLVPVHPPGDDSKSVDLLHRALDPAGPSALVGRPLTLLEALSAVEASSTRQLEVIGVYWRLTTAVAEYRFAHAAHQALEQLAAEQGSAPPLTAAVTAARTRLEHARLAAVESQHDLAERLSLRPDDTLPLAADPPVVTAYRTHYETIFANRPLPANDLRRARRLHDTLPLLLETIRAAAAAVEAAEEIAAMTRLTAQRDGVDPMAPSRAQAELHALRRAFLDAVRDYNLAIGQYALIVAPEGTLPTALMPMLIKTTPARMAEPSLLSQPPLGSLRQLREPSLAAPPAATNPSGVVQAAGEQSLPTEPGRLDSLPPGEDARPLRSVVVPSRRP